MTAMSTTPFREGVRRVCAAGTGGPRVRRGAGEHYLRRHLSWAAV